jgi:GMP synthase PP-ATPase subunit
MATRLIKEVRGVNGVVYDVTAKPPRTIASHVIARRPL